MKIKQRPEGKAQQPRRSRGFLRLSRWPRARSVRIEVVYRGGSESWWLLRARGESQVFPGHLSLEDVMARVLSER